VKPSRRRSSASASARELMDYDGIGPRRRSGKNLVAMGRTRSNQEARTRRRGQKAVSNEDEEWESASQVKVSAPTSPLLKDRSFSGKRTVR
jgi:hypothetical protein